LKDYHWRSEAVHVYQSAPIAANVDQKRYLTKFVWELQAPATLVLQNFWRSKLQTKVLILWQKINPEY
jgi:hypothetical protein